ncbi:MAG: hypothetical protein II670_01875, partial [Alphaproteobacteria bacterium]|nr:hypothetical protein [Alphaproteobacteria bacterium]
VHQDIRLKNDALSLSCLDAFLHLVELGFLFGSQVICCRDPDVTDSRSWGNKTNDSLFHIAKWQYHNSSRNCSGYRN